jgi:rare lipoprotein A
MLNLQWESGMPQYRSFVLALVATAVLAAPAWAVNQRGVASWYGPRFHGRRAASGEVFNEHELTAAHRTLPFGTVVRVTNLENGRSVVVRINDRGPYVKGTILDLSHAAAQRLDIIRQGRARIALSILQECE